VKRNASPIVGDLLEEYREVVLPSRGRARATLWFADQLASLVRPWMWGPIIAAFVLIARWFEHFLEPLGTVYTREPYAVFPIACGIALGVVAYASSRQRRRWHAGFSAAMVAAVALTFSTIVLEYGTSYTATRYYRGVITGRRSVLSLMDTFGRKRFRRRVEETAYRFPGHFAGTLMLGAASGAIGAGLGRIERQKMTRE